MAFDPESMMKANAFGNTEVGKRKQDISDSAWVLREGIFAKSRTVDSALTVMPSVGKAAQARLGQINLLLQDDFRGE